MNASLGTVRVGPAGWSYDDWKGIVYPPDMPRGHHPLRFLSELFDTVEINTSYYRPLNPRHGIGWLAHVADNPRFMFTAKLWKRFTHERETWPGPADADVVRKGLDPLAEAGKLGALLVQFPWSFKRTLEERQWLARVVETFSEYPLVVELRHASWNDPEVFQSFAERKIAFCNIDQPLFRQSLPPTAHVTAPVGYVRLHGQNHNDWFRESATRNDRYDYLYSQEELKPWIDKIESIQRDTSDVYVVTNNHYKGQAVVNALELEEGLGRREFVLPRHLVEAYPRLKRLLAAHPG